MHGLVSLRYVCGEITASSQPIHNSRPYKTHWTFQQRWGTRTALRADGCPFPAQAGMLLEALKWTAGYLTASLGWLSIEFDLQRKQTTEVILIPVRLLLSSCFLDWRFSPHTGINMGGYWSEFGNRSSSRLNHLIFLSSPSNKSRFTKCSFYIPLSHWWGIFK